MSDREAFEAFIDKLTINGRKVIEIPYYVEITGVYCFDDLEMAWQTWQAAINYNRPPTGYAPCKNQCEAIATRTMIKQLKAEINRLNEKLQNSTDQ